MRATINLPDDLLARLETLAAESGTTVTALVHDALREALARRRRIPRDKRVELVLLPDVNVLVCAHRADAPGHARYRTWLNEVIRSNAACGMSDLVLGGFLRVVTHPRVFRDPTPLTPALAFATEVRERANCIAVLPDERHRDSFTRLCRAVGARGSLVPDAHRAALAIESGAEWVTTDRDYARFPGLRWRHPPG